MSRQIVLDTETTGLSADSGDRIIELGCVELLNRKLTGNNLHMYFNPGRDSHEDALKIHRISNEFLKDKPRFAEMVDDDRVALCRATRHAAAFVGLRRGRTWQGHGAVARPPVRGTSTRALPRQRRF